MSYLANWSHSFFGISDGAIVSIAIAEVVPEWDGAFAIEVPDFANDRVIQSYKDQAQWSIAALRSGTGDQYSLDSERQVHKAPGRLAIQSEYPSKTRFIPQKH